MAEKYEEAGTRLEKAAALFEQAEQLAAAGQWDPLYDLLTPYVLGMEEAPGLKGMKSVWAATTRLRSRPARTKLPLCLSR